MKKLFVAVAALGMLLTSCAKDDVQSSGGNGVAVSFEIAQPTIASRALATEDATKVFGTGVAAEDLQYAIYEAEKDPVTGIFTIRDNGQEPISGVEDGFFAQDKLINTLENIRLVRGKRYIALFWAQSDAVNGPWNVDWATQEISLKDKESLVAQDENLDAFFTRVDFEVDAVASSQTFNAELKRPFAQVNVLTADAKEAQLAGLDVYESSIEVSGVYTSMNLMTGAVDGETTLTYNMAEKGSYMMSVDNTDYDLLSMNYLLVNTRKTVDITFYYNEDATVQGNDDTVFKAEFDMVPVERNYRTNIIGDILTSAVSFKIVINPIFTDDIIHDITKTPEDLLVEAAAKGGSYTLASDVVLTSTVNVAKDLTLDLNGFNITTQVDNKATDAIVVAAGATLTINGEGTVEAVSGNDGYAVVAEGTVIINDGTYKAGVDENGETNAVVYARGKGQVYVNGGNFPNDANSAFVLNKKDADRDNTVIEVKGGEFVNFNPANNAAEGAGTNFMAEGYTTEAAEVDGKTVYSVVEIVATPIATPAVEVAVEGNVVTLTWKAVEGAAKYAVTVNEETVEVENTTYEFTGEYETEYAFSVVAIAADTVWNTDSEATEVTATTEAEPSQEVVYTTVAEFLAADVDDATYYTLKGTITRVANDYYGNFDLTDETGTIYVYGLYSEDGATSKYWATSGAKLGDDIVISAVRAEFSGSAQAGSARFVSLVSPGTLPFYNVSKDIVNFSSTGGEDVIVVSKYNTDATVTATSNNTQFVVSVNGDNVTISAAANELEEEVTGTVTIKVGDLAETEVYVILAEKPAAGVVEGGQDDFDTLTVNTGYTSGKTSAGWAYTSAAIHGSSNVSAISDDSIGLTINGKTSAKGSITSPVITTGCGNLKFNYAYGFSESNGIDFTVTVKQNGAVVYEKNVKNTTATKNNAYTFKANINVAGDFQIEITNNSPTNSSSNKDRYTFWDIKWTGYVAE